MNPLQGLKVHDQLLPISFGTVITVSIMGREHYSNFHTLVQVLRFGTC